MNSEKQYEARLLNLKDLKKIIYLQETVYEELIDKSKLKKLTEEEYNFILSDNGIMVGIYVEYKLIAARALLAPANDPDHLGLAIGLRESELHKVIYQEISLVHSEYQGNGLQSIMGEFIMNELDTREHSYSYVCATVAPDNIPSIKDKFKQNMEIRAYVTIYGGKKRYVFAKELIKDTSKRIITKKNYLELANVNEIKKHLDLNWIGINLLQKNESYYIELIQYKP